MTSPRTGKAVANQFTVETNEGEYFQSYDSVIVFKPFNSVEDVGTERAKKITLDAHYWNYSKTTSKYRNEFLGETTKETQAKIDSGEYVLANLN